MRPRKITYQVMYEVTYDTFRLGFRAVIILIASNQNPVRQHFDYWGLPDNGEEINLYDMQIVAVSGYSHPPGVRG